MINLSVTQCFEKRFIWQTFFSNLELNYRRSLICAEGSVALNAWYQLLKGELETRNFLGLVFKNPLMFHDNRKLHFASFYKDCFIDKRR